MASFHMRVLNKYFFLRKSTYCFVVSAPHAWTGHMRRVAEQLLETEPKSRVVIYCANKKTLFFVRKWKKNLSLNSVRTSLLGFGPSFYNSSAIFVSHGLPIPPFTPKIEYSKVVMLWHGYGSKRHEKVWNPPPGTWIASGKSEAESLKFEGGIPEGNIKILGSARSDYLINSQNKLPIDIQQEISNLENRFNGKRLVLFAPTWDTYKDNPEIFISDCAILKQISNKFGVTLAVRPHPDILEKVINQVEALGIVILSFNMWPNTESVIRVSDLLVTDYSSIWADYLLLEKPMISIYEPNRTGFNAGIFLELFPGLIFESMDQFHDYANSLKSFEDLLIHPKLIPQKNYVDSKNLIYGNYSNGQVGKRIFEYIKKSL